MRVRSIIVITLMLATAACSTYRREFDSNPPFSSHYYRIFDVEVAWQAERSGQDVRLSGTVTNRRYAFLRDLELKARLFDAQGNTLARESNADFPPLAQNLN
jgi:starvation-inducible outer membrane lipoprotein